MGDVDDADVIAEVDGSPITRPIFRELLRDDQGGGCSLVYLPQWVLPSVASWTRDRDVLARATRDEALGAATHAMQHSEAHWIHKLVAAQLDAIWRVLCPDLDRGFLVKLDGITTNFDLKALVAEALLDAGVPGERNPPDVIDVIRGKRDHASRDYVVQAFDFLTYGGLEHLRGPRGAMPLEHVVWGEGVPTDVPIHDGIRTILVTPITIERTWSGGRPFSALHASASVERELARDELAALLGNPGRSS